MYTVKLFQIKVKLFQIKQEPPWIYKMNATQHIVSAGPCEMR